MTRSSKMSANPATHDWYSQSGFNDIDLLHSGPHDRAEMYCKRLVSYIKDVSTVRVRCLDMFGRAPSIEEIAIWRSDHIRTLEKRAGERICFNDEIVIPKVLKLPERPKPRPNNRIRQENPLTNKAFVHNDMRSASDVVVACAAAFGLTYHDLCGESRLKQIVAPRHLAFAVLKARGNSYPNCGKHLGGRDHSTVIHGCRKFFDKGLRNPDMVKAWEKLAPCIFKAVRTFEEFEALIARKV